MSNEASRAPEDTYLPTYLRFLSHNLQKKPILSSQILRHLKNDFDILFLQEINQAPILPHVYAYGSGTKATIVSNISQDKHSRGDHGSVLVSSPRFARFVNPLRKVYSDFNTVFLPLLLLAAGVRFPAACF